MNLELIDEIIAKNVTITDQSLYEGVFSAVLEAIDNENEACAMLCLEQGKPNPDDADVEFSHLASYEFGKQVGAATCAAMIRARREG